MPRIELTIESTYVDWGLWEAVRELMQNGIDAQTEGHPFTVHHSERSQTLRLRTEGTVLTTRTLLLGNTSKRGRDDQIGKFGEGYKLGLLALVNSGHEVRIRTADEVWEPKIAESKAFGGAKVLCIDSRKAKEHVNSILIEVGGVTAQAWDEIQARFLFLRPCPDSTECNLGTILRGDAFKGKIFLSGIFVQEIDELEYGYDFPSSKIKLDRDRRMVDRWDLDWATSSLWGSLAAKHDDFLPTLIEMMREGKPDVRYVKASNANDTLVARIVEKFTKTHGANSVPVANEGEAETAKAYGRHGIVVPESLREILAVKLGTLDALKTEFGKQAKEMSELTDLREEWTDNLIRAVTLVSTVHPSLTLERVQVVEFTDPCINGLYCNGEIQIAKRLLGDFKATLTTIVHEVAHDHSAAADATVDFEKSLQTIWAEIVNYLMS